MILVDRERHFWHSSTSYLHHLRNRWPCTLDLRSYVRFAYGFNTPYRLSQISFFGTSEVRTHDPSIVEKTRCQLCYRNSLKQSSGSSAWKIIYFWRFEKALQHSLKKYEKFEKTQTFCLWNKLLILLSFLTNNYFVALFCLLNIGESGSRLEPCQQGKAFRSDI